MKKASRYLLWMSIGLVVVVVITLFFMLKHQLYVSAWEPGTSQQIGRILYLFVEDEGRMPLDEGELWAKGYLETRKDGQTYPGKRITGRGTPLGDLQDLPLLFRAKVKVRYGTGWRRGQIIECPDEMTGYKFSAMITDLLEKTRAPTTTTSSSPA